MESIHAKQPHNDQGAQDQEQEIAHIVKTSRRKHAKRRS